MQINNEHESLPYSNIADSDTNASESAIIL